MFCLPPVYQTSANLKSAKKWCLNSVVAKNEFLDCFFPISEGRSKDRPNRCHISNKGLSIVVSLSLKKKKILCLAS